MTLMSGKADTEERASAPEKAGAEPGDAEPPRFMSVKQAAAYLQVNEKKIYALVREGKIPATKLTGKWLFPRDLVDQWLLESSHGGLLTDRIVVAGSDDPLLFRAVTQVATTLQSKALISYAATGSQLGLTLLARRRADVCGIHWGPAEQSDQRHPALLRQYVQAGDWALVRLFRREQGLLAAFSDRGREVAKERNASILVLEILCPEAEAVALEDRDLVLAVLVQADLAHALRAVAADLVAHLDAVAARSRQTDVTATPVAVH